MEERYFIEAQDLVNKVLKKLKPFGRLPEYFNKIYIEPKTEQKWEKYVFELEGSVDDAIGLRKIPYPNTDKLIDIALTSPYLDEVDGAAGLLLDLEYDKIEFREKLLNEIEKNINKISVERYEIIYHRAELTDTSNKREIKGKYISEIEADANYFEGLAIRSEKLKARINANNKS